MVSLAHAQTSAVYISEFVASSDTSFKDQFGAYPDWIELHNSSDVAVNLENWGLSDDVLAPGKWKFPSIEIAAGEYLIVFASGNDLNNPHAYLHTNFKLSAAGESLILSNAKGEIVSGFQTDYPSQITDISYAWVDGSYIYMKAPTPASANIGIRHLFPPLFNVQRGVYSSSFSLDLIPGNKGVSIKYTTDGSAPDIANGLDYSGPISISSTTVVRAICLENNATSASVTHTYIFPKNVLVQPDFPKGYPVIWGTDVPADYGMDYDICKVSEYRDSILKALNNMPIVSISTKVDNLFLAENDSETGGIYANTSKRWERPASIEIIEPQKDASVQANCGLLLQGGASRIPSRSPKHSFRVAFRSEYGPSKLKYELYEDTSAVKSFDDLCLKATYNNSWIHMTSSQRERAQYMRDVWAKMTYRQMGNIGLHTKYALLYLNGLFWGLYNISERADADFMESYFGGEKEEYDVLKDNITDPIDGTADTWNTLLSKVREGLTSDTAYFELTGKNPDGSDNSNIPSYVNPISMADYMLLNFYAGNGDWDHKNWSVAMHRKGNTRGFYFIPWDEEQILTGLSTFTKEMVSFNETCPSEVFLGMMKNDEFKLLFADRVQKHLYNDGSLTPENVTKNWDILAGQIEQAVYAESARWGDYRRDVVFSDSLLYTPEYWKEQKNYLQQNLFPYRTDTLLLQLDTLEWMPSISAPLFSKHGGVVPSDFKLGMTAEEGEIYFDLKGNDPRLIGGSIASDALKFDSDFSLNPGKTLVKARAKSGDNWSALTAATFICEASVDTITNSTGTNSVMVNTPNNLFISPNPANDYTKLMFSIAAQGHIRVEIINIQGKVVQIADFGWMQQGEHSLHLDVNKLANGMYICVLKGKNLQLQAKMMIRK